MNPAPVFHPGAGDELLNLLDLCKLNLKEFAKMCFEFYFLFKMMYYFKRALSQRSHIKIKEALHTCAKESCHMSQN